MILLCKKNKTQRNKLLPSKPKNRNNEYDITVIELMCPINSNFSFENLSNL